MKKAAVRVDSRGQVGEMTQASLIELLRSHPFSRGLAEEQLGVLVGIAQNIPIPADEPVFVSGERSEYFYLLLSGTIFLELQTHAFSVCIQRLSAGEAFGWSALVDEPYRAFQIRARETCEVIRLQGEQLLAACEADDALGSWVFRQLAALVARRLRATEVRFTEFCGLKTGGRSSKAAAPSTTGSQD